MNHLARQVSSAMIGLLLGLGDVGAAHADPATAEVLFREGRRLLDENDLEGACAKLDESMRQDASSGTLINLALCHEKQGRIATAWAEYVASVRLANAQGKPERAEVAAKKSTELEPELPRIGIRAAAAVPSMVIMRGDQRVGPGALGTATPVDPDTYAIVVTAPGYRGFTTRVTIARGETQWVDVPPLERERELVTEVPSIGAAARKIEPPRTNYVAWSGAVAGVLAVGVGSAFAVSSLGAYSDAKDVCPSRSDCDGRAIDLRSRAETQAWVANVAVGVGIVAVATSLYFFLLHAPASASRSPGPTVVSWR